jgi:hypothetical protein
MTEPAFAVGADSTQTISSKKASPPKRIAENVSHAFPGLGAAIGEDVSPRYPLDFGKLAQPHRIFAWRALHPDALTCRVELTQVLRHPVHLDPSRRLQLGERL